MLSNLLGVHVVQEVGKDVTVVLKITKSLNNHYKILVVVCTQN